MVETFVKVEERNFVFVEFARLRSFWDEGQELPFQGFGSVFQFISLVIKQRGVDWCGDLLQFDYVDAGAGSQFDVPIAFAGAFVLKRPDQELFLVVSKCGPKGNDDLD